jgi:2-oxoglutarate dehydrogenase E2 component (dihydrolipoamide succinyltransferase)
LRLGQAASKLQRIATIATEIRVPKIAASATKASIGRWFKRVGDPVSLDEPLVEIETDGTTVEMTAPATGVLSEILLTDGKTVTGGTLLGTITEYGSGIKTPGAR